jgi:hypothetical protein
MPPIDDEGKRPACRDQRGVEKQLQLRKRIDRFSLFILMERA